MNPVHALHALGQSIWYDNIRRKILLNRYMASMVERGEIRGVTSNPSIFHTAIAKTGDYDAPLAYLTHLGLSAAEIAWRLAVEDIQSAGEIFLPLYEETAGADGYASLEVDPALAHNTAGTVEAAKMLWERVDRPNLMVKIPATLAGLPAITEAIAAGINVNVTLIFSRERYAGVMDAYLTGLERRVAAGQPIDQIASVASFFVSRVDTAVDRRLRWLDDPTGRATQLLGRTAIANTRLAYADHREIFAGDRFRALAEHGARVQRPLWASTSTKNPAYRDVMYVEELIGPGTVNTVPPDTLVAFIDHGHVRPSLTEDLAGARETLATLHDLGISLPEVTDELEQEGVRAFADAFTALVDAVEERRQAMLS